MMKYLRFPWFAAAVVLLIEIVAFYLIPKSEIVPHSRQLSGFSRNLDRWQTAQETAVEEEVLNLLKADDTLNRVYVDAATGTSVSLFVAFFKTQRAGAQPHSPKVCLPGSGWVPTSSAVIPVTVPGTDEPVKVNRYIVQRGEDRSLVLYWYQTPWRTVASEYAAKVFLVLDSIRHRRSDTSMVRVVVPVGAGTQEQAEAVGIGFVRSVFAPLRQYLPGRELVDEHAGDRPERRRRGFRPPRSLATGADSHAAETAVRTALPVHGFDTRTHLRIPVAASQSEPAGAAWLM